MGGKKDSTTRYSIRRVFRSALWALKQRPDLFIGPLILCIIVLFAASFALALPLIGLLVGFDELALFHTDDFLESPVGVILPLLTILPLIFAVSMLHLIYLRAFAEVLSGGHPTLADTFRGSLSRALPFLALWLLCNLAWTLGTLLLIVPGLILLVRWSAALPAFANEPLGIFTAMSRSARLTRGARWQTLGAILLLFLAFVLPFAVVFAFDRLSGEPQAPPSELTAGEFLLSFFIGTLTAVWTAAHYVELRRLEDARGAPLPA